MLANKKKSKTNFFFFQYIHMGQHFYFKQAKHGDVKVG